MTVKVSCTCGQSFKAKDELAGKKVRCPKCSQPLMIPLAEEPDEFRLQDEVVVPKYNPLLDILDEEGVKHEERGPVCPSCDEPIHAGAVLCVQCGFNLQTGERVYSDVDQGEGDDSAMAGMSETEKMLYKAEKEIEDMPISAENEKFGDEADSYFIALGGIIITAIVVVLSVFLIVQLDKIEDFNTAAVSGWMSLLFAAGAIVSVTINAFKERPLQGYLCLTVVYTLWYSMTRGQYVSLGIIVLFGSIAAGCFSYLGSATGL